MIKLEHHQRLYKNIFEREKKKLCVLLKKQRIKKIVHIGSTSVPFCLNGGVVDILIGIPNMLDLLTFNNILSRKGYKLLESQSSPSLLTFLINDDEGKLVATLRIAEYATPEYNKYIAFKNFLIKEKNNVLLYNKFRQSAVEIYEGNEEKYSEAKDKYFFTIFGDKLL